MSNVNAILTGSGLQSNQSSNKTAPLLMKPGPILTMTQKPNTIATALALNSSQQVQGQTLTASSVATPSIESLIKAGQQQTNSRYYLLTFRFNINSFFVNWHVFLNCQYTSFFCLSLNRSVNTENDGII